MMTVAVTVGYWELLLRMGSLGVAMLVGIFGGGALFYFGWRKLLQKEDANYWASVGGYLLATLSGMVVFCGISVVGLEMGGRARMIGPVVGIVPALLMSWLLLKMACHINYGQAIVAWLPTLGAKIAAALLALPLLAPAVYFAREKAFELTCEENLAVIVRAVNAHSYRNTDIPPENLGMLVKDGDLPARVLKCPGSRGNGREIDYFYFPPTSKTPARGLVLCTFSDGHGGKIRNIARLDERVETLTPEGFKAELSRPENLNFAAALYRVE
ncbi:MAG: hypothetical protein ACYS8X_03310 [Planctomycetota bacterium]|jgi:hypothetical protein